MHNIKKSSTDESEISCFFDFCARRNDDIIIFLCKVLMIFQNNPFDYRFLGRRVLCVYVVCLKLVSIIAIIQQRACHDDGDDDLRGWRGIESSSGSHMHFRWISVWDFKSVLQAHTSINICQSVFFVSLALQRCRRDFHSIFVDIKWTEDVECTALHAYKVSDLDKHRGFHIYNIFQPGFSSVLGNFNPTSCCYVNRRKLSRFSRN